MAIGITFFVVALLIIGIYLSIEVKRMKHKIYSVFLIGLILFTYFGFATSLKGQDVDLTSFDGIIHAGKLYMSWLGSMFMNAKSITAYAFKQNWTSYNKTVLKPKPNKTDEIWSKL